MIWNECTSSDLKTTIKEMSRFNNQIRDDPLELLKVVEHLMHVPMKAVYPTLTLIETIARMMSLKQGEKEGLATYLEHFKSKKNAMINLFGKSILDGYVEKVEAYQNLCGTVAEIEAIQKVMKNAEMQKF